MHANKVIFTDRNLNMPIAAYKIGICKYNNRDKIAMVCLHFSKLNVAIT